MNRETAGPDRSRGADAVPGGPGDPVLTIEDLSIDYVGETTVHAVRDVTLSLGRNEILGLAGESGCGKSTLAYGVVRLLRPPGMITAGRLLFHPREGDPVDLRALSGEQLRAFRWDRVSMVFQGAMNSLNPVISIRAQLEDVFTTHRPELGRHDRRERCAQLLERVGVDRSRLRSYPHELSGGMRQRVMIAMAMALNPQIMIMDEPTTALDVVVQREILREITRLRAEFGFAVLFITHDLPLLLEISDRIAVMREGRLVEVQPSVDLFTAPRHRYTRRLLASFPSLTGDRGAFLRADVEAATGRVDPADDDLEDDEPPDDDPPDDDPPDRVPAVPGGRPDEGPAEAVAVPEAAGEPERRRG